MKEADPAVIVTAVPRGEVPSRNCTVPVAEGGVTAAVNVTAWPAIEELTEELTVTPAVTLLTVCAKAAEVLALELASPLYAAVMECVPTAGLVLVKRAEPALTGTGLPKGVEPSENWTVPVTEAGVIFAVKVTACPAREGFKEEASETLVLTLVTTWATVGEVAAVSLASPPYEAVIEWVATDKVEVVNVARPLTDAEAPNGVVPSRKMIGPVAEGGVSRAVNVTACPKADGFNEEVSVKTETTLLTVCTRGAEVSAVWLASPL